MADAALHTGELTIRRSPLLDVRTLDRSGVARIDLPRVEMSGMTGGADDPLGVRPFEAYGFASVPFTVRLAVAPVAARVGAVAQTVLKLVENQSSLESRVTFDVQGRPIYQLQMLLPEELRLDRVSAPGEFQYTVTQPAAAPRDKRRLLTIYLAEGRQGDVPVLIYGRLDRVDLSKELTLPRLEALGVERQRGDVAVQVDPAFDVEAARLVHCETVLLSQLFGWLGEGQRDVTRLALRYAQGDYAGLLRLKPRKSEVACDTITNVRVTDWAVEETILLDFAVRGSGVRRLSFLLPPWMAGSRISVPMLRQKTVEPVGPAADAPLRVTIELQNPLSDGRLRVLVQNDRLLTPGSHEAPIPVVESEKIAAAPSGAGPAAGGSAEILPAFKTNHRWVVVESAGATKW